MTCGPSTGWCGNVRPGEPYTRDQCQRCWLMAHSAPHRANWKVEGPAVEVRKATAPPKPLAPGVRVPLPVRMRPCVALGAKAKPNCGCTDRHCLKGRGVVRHLVECQTCPADLYEPKPTAIRPLPRSPADAVPTD